ncbi:hypothetical protein BaRGS_00010128 [Batillaria attramentaria]|uniref:Uncharacterized protein n=1 Tax=Batillaria attramentaria TaxID=370345 RepID=A0ABD0LH79_9CAEN
MRARRGPGSVWSPVRQSQRHPGLNEFHLRRMQTLRKLFHYHVDVRRFPPYPAPIRRGHGVSSTQIGVMYYCLVSADLRKPAILTRGPWYQLPGQLPVLG